MFNIIEVMSQTDLHTEFINSLIKDPINTYLKLDSKFKANSLKNLNNNFNELWPVVNYLYNELYSNRVLNLVEEDLSLSLLRKIAINELRHITLKSKSFLPYLTTINTIANALSFFDIVVRKENLVLTNLKAFNLEEENPREQNLAYYHRYRYLYYYHYLIKELPNLYLIPSHLNYSATDMMKFRCVPVFILGVSNSLIYVDEFEQTPIEFFIHDVNHARRQYESNLKWFNDNNIDNKNKKDIYNDSYLFSKALLEKILSNNQEIHNTEINKLKKIILFEIVHEDAEMFLPDVIINSLLRVEGFEADFEVPIIDYETNLMDIKITKEVGISTLSYVRHKLQNGFYDRTHEINNNIVNKDYRTSKNISLAAFELLNDVISINNQLNLSFNYLNNDLLNKVNNINQDWLLERTTSAGPEVVHKSVIDDPDLEETKEINKKNYFILETQRNHLNFNLKASLDYQTVNSLEEFKLSVDAFITDNKSIILIKRNIEPYNNYYTLPGGFIRENETQIEALNRILNSKLNIDNHKILKFNFNQVGFYDDINRDPRGRIATLIFKTVISTKELNSLKDKYNLELFNFNNLPKLGFDHSLIIKQIK